MSASAEFLNPSEAAKRLGISAKALRLYEQRGLIAPVRSVFLARLRHDGASRLGIQRKRCRRLDIFELDAAPV